MARAPTRVSATAGQGVSRKSYQTAYRLGMHGAGSAGGGSLPKASLLKPPAASTSSISSSRESYPKNGPTGASLNVAYSEREMPNPDLKSLKKVAALKPPKPRKGFL